MNFEKFKHFAKKLSLDLSATLLSKSLEDFESQEQVKDMDDLSHQISKKLRLKPELSKIIVIDEIDAFERYAQDFLTLFKQILASNSRTVLIGIANSVDLPFKHKHSAVALRN